MRNNININLATAEETGRDLVSEFMRNIRVRLDGATVEEAVNSGDEARTTVLGSLHRLFSELDMLGLNKLTSEYRRCIEESTVKGRTGLFALTARLNQCTDRYIERLQQCVQECLDSGIEPKNAVKMLAQVRSLRNNGQGYSVFSAAARVLMYIVQVTASKVGKLLGFQTEGTIWSGLGKALRCLGGILKAGLKVTFYVTKGIACFAVSAATKLGKMFMKAFYIAVGALKTWSEARNARINEAVDEIFEEVMDGFDDFEFEDDFCEG